MFPAMPQYQHNWGRYQGNRLIHEHLNWNYNELQRISADRELQLNHEQKTAYNNILDSIGNGTNTPEFDNTVNIPEYMK
ncbi:11134_t:CDS:2, partial [Gigaspora rosea]